MSDVKITAPATEENKRYAALIDEFNKDFILNDTNIRDKSLMIAGLKSKWVQLWIAERKRLTKLGELRKRLKDEYVREHGRPDVPKLNTERGADADAKIAKVNQEIEYSEECFDYLDDMKKVAHQFTWDIKNSTELLKQESR